MSERQNMKRLPTLPCMALPLILASCMDSPAPGGAGGTDASTSTADSSTDGDENPADTTTARPPEASGGVEDESSDEEGGTTSFCGDGIVDPGEACDDGNDAQADGCNIDCTVSGSVLWTVQLPESLGVSKIHFDAKGHILLGGVSFGDRFEGFVSVEFDADGELIDQRSYIPSIDPPPGTAEIRFGSLHDVEFRAGGQAVFSALFEFRDAVGELLGGDSGLVAEQGASASWQALRGGWGLYFGVDAGDNVYGGARAGGGQVSVLKVAPSGEVLVSREHAMRSSSLFEDAVSVLSDGGLVVGGVDIMCFDADGSLRWSVPWDEHEDSRPRQVWESAGGEVQVVGSLGENYETVGYQWLTLSPAGDIEDSVSWGAEDAVLPLYAEDSAGHVTTVSERFSGPPEYRVMKFNPDRSPRWPAEVVYPNRVNVFAVDDAGATVLVNFGYELIKLAP